MSLKIKFFGKTNSLFFCTFLSHSFIAPVRTASMLQMQTKEAVQEICQYAPPPPPPRLPQKHPFQTKARFLLINNRIFSLRYIRKNILF